MQIILKRLFSQRSLLFKERWCYVYKGVDKLFAFSYSCNKSQIIKRIVQGRICAISVLHGTAVLKYDGISMAV